MADSRDRVKPLSSGQLRRLPLWLPVLVGFGILLRLEHWGIASPWICAAMAGAAVLATMHARPWSMMLAAGIAALLVGVLSAQLRLDRVSAPVLGASVSAPVSGRVLLVDRARSGATRVLIDDVRIEGLHPAVTPERVRITLLGATAGAAVGNRIRTKARLSPPPGPAAPGAFDFSRAAWFSGLGAVGYARGDVEEIETAGPEPLIVKINRFRGRIAAELRSGIGGAAGAVAAALAVGDRSGIDEDVRDALRDSGLAHLLAISGLHVGLLSSLIYVAIRFLLALPPHLSERVATRKIAAVCALAAAFGYLLISGMGIATQRACIMAAVVFAAILLDRPAVTMRALAVAATLILILRPESLFEAGFQMSFAAVAALVAIYDATRTFWRRRSQMRGWRSILWTFVLATLVTSAVAGAATAPFAAYHFNRLVLYGLPANLFATPLMGACIMPLLILSAVLWPFGLEWMAYPLLDVALSAILSVADAVAGMEDAVLGIAAAPPVALAATVLAGLWVAIWRGGLRIIGVVVLVSALPLWQAQSPPDLLVSADARLIAGRDSDGLLWLSRERAEPFAADLWLRRAGDVSADRLAAFERRQWQCRKDRCSGTTTGAIPVLLLRRPARDIPDCDGMTIILAPDQTQETSSTTDSPCIVLDSGDFRDASSFAIHLGSGEAPATHIARRWRPPPLFGQ